MELVARKKENNANNNTNTSFDEDRNKYVFWYTRGVRTQTSYEDNIKKIVDFSTVEIFWVFVRYCRILLTAMVGNGLFDLRRLCQAVSGSTWF
ncbi:eukaryotic translation initiation factor NCBP-like [Salvia divinorum]|uniref:mRNA cap-binding protein n=1 Tax=Salvia divinorum TaxID=28513 RepID=A0ABD1HUE6_SALDI